MPSLDTGNTAWVLASSALVLIMTPGWRSYGGMIRARHVLNMLIMNFICMALATVAWVLYGWSLSFGNANDASGNSFWGGLSQWGMHHIVFAYSFTVPLILALLVHKTIGLRVAGRPNWLAWTRASTPRPHTTGGS